MSKPITEAVNALSEDIDVASPQGIVTILQKCDQEIFDGFETYKSLFHEDTIHTIEAMAGHMASVLKDPENGIVVFSGCGTSGRLGYIVARTFNEFQAFERSPEVFHYLLAGGDKALFTSQEAPEDDPRVGVEGLKQLSAGKQKVVFVGITCGLSAPYVAGQLDFCLQHPGTYIPVLLGFNPVSLARNIQIESWDKTFRQVANKLEEFSKTNGQGYILNPVVGPETITGSSRMKSGSATKILLETLCMKALVDSRSQSTKKWPVSDFISCYRLVCDAVYAQSGPLSQAVESAGSSLSKGGRLYYYGNDSLALMGLIDSSECPPTYGATLDDVRGFVKSGYKTMQNKEGDLTQLGKHFRISDENLVTDIEMSDKDTVVILDRDGSVLMPSNIQSAPCKKVLFTFQESLNPEGFDTVIRIGLPVPRIDDLIGQDSREVANQMFCEMATKWCLNAISTGAHVLKGKVYRNTMIDVKVSNNKLYHRAIGILERVGKLSRETATDFLLRSIYDVDSVSDTIRNAPVWQHIQTATPKDLVVPSALMAAVSNSSILDAKLALSKQPVIRSAVVDLLKND